MRDFLRELLEYGFITLPNMSHHFYDAILRALEGDTFPLKKALGKLVPYADKLIDVESIGEYFLSWRDKTFSNLFVTYRVLMFYYVVTTQAEREINNAFAQHQTTNQKPSGIRKNTKSSGKKSKYTKDS